MRTLGTVTAAALARLATAAQAQTTGSLTLNSQPGDSIGGGPLWQYDQTAASFSTSSDGSMIAATVWPFDGGWWTVQLASPPGQNMTVGSYENAVRASFRPAGPPGNIYGMGRGRNQTAGRFDLTEVTFGLSNHVLELLGNFEQHCEFQEAPALFGELYVQNLPPRPALALGLSVTPGALPQGYQRRRLTGHALSRNKPADVNLGVAVTQRISRTAVTRGFSSQSVHCEAPGKAIEVVVSESSGGAFVNGRPAEISTSFRASIRLRQLGVPDRHSGLRRSRGRSQGLGVEPFGQTLWKPRIAPEGFPVRRFDAKLARFREGHHRGDSYRAPGQEHRDEDPPAAVVLLDRGAGERQDGTRDDGA